MIKINKFGKIIDTIRNKFDKVVSKVNNVDRNKVKSLRISKSTGIVRTKDENKTIFNHVLSNATYISSEGLVIGIGKSKSIGRKHVKADSANINTIPFTILDIGDTTSAVLKVVRTFGEFQSKSP